MEGVVEWKEWLMEEIIDESLRVWLDDLWIALTKAMRVSLTTCQPVVGENVVYLSHMPLQFYLLSL